MENYRACYSFSIDATIQCLDISHWLYKEGLAKPSKNGRLSQKI